MLRGRSREDVKPSQEDLARDLFFSFLHSQGDSDLQAKLLLYISNGDPDAFTDHKVVALCRERAVAFARSNRHTPVEKETATSTYFDQNIGEVLKRARSIP